MVSSDVEAVSIQVTSTPSVGRLLRSYRRRAGLTQEQLAERSGYSPDYVSKLERNQRHPPVVALDRLAAVLGLSSVDRDALHASRARPLRARSAAGDVPNQLAASPLSGTAGQSAAPIGLPLQLTSFVGREQEVAAVQALLHLGTTRLLTLTGAGGIGKTRLAIQVAEQFRDSFSDGMYFVPLAALRDPEHVVSAVAATLGLKDVVGISLTDVIARYIERKKMLLLLDNFEHVLGAAAFVATLVAHCAELQILVTSRSALQLTAEQRFEVRPLPTPSKDSLADFDAVAGQPAVRLFVERARAVRETFELNPQTAMAVGAICTSLDGLPLAIELAAAWVRVFPPHALLQRLSPKLGLLSGGASDRPVRHQTLRATIDWSYDLLPQSEQRLFARLSVFAGGCTFDATQRVCNPDEALEILADLTSLVDKSLVRQVGDREPRFSLLETIREYAAEKLTENGEPDRIRQLHALYVAAIALQAEPLLIGPRQFEVLQQLDAELDNVRAALTWFLERNLIEEELGLATALYGFWVARGLCSEARQWLEAGLARSSGLADACRAAALLALGGVAIEHGHLDGANGPLEEALSMFRRLGDQAGIGKVSSRLGLIAWRQGAYERAAACDELALRIATAVGDRWERAHALVNLGVVATHRGDFALARARLTEALQLAREIGDRNAVVHALVNLGYDCTLRGQLLEATAIFEEVLATARTYGLKKHLAYALENLGNISVLQGDYATATARLQQCVTLGRELSDRHLLLYALGDLTKLAAAQGMSERAARLEGVVDGLRGQLGVSMAPAEDEDRERALRRARETLGTLTYGRLFDDGRTLPFDEALTFALA